MISPALLTTAQFCTGYISNVVPAVFVKSLSVGGGNRRVGALGAVLLGPLYPTMMPARRNVCLNIGATSIVIVWLAPEGV
jgi:hypothetical protein